jgi:hypothetical protein
MRLERRDWQLMLGALALFAGSVYATFPGTLSYDSVAQWEQALSGRFTDWHPPIMAWMWSHLAPATLGPRGLFLLQMALYWLVFLALALALDRQRWLVLGIGLLPVTINFSFVLWKDVWMAIALGFCAASAIMAMRSERRWPWLLAGWLALAAGLLFRANAPLAWLLLLAMRQRGWLALLLAAPLSVLLLIGAQTLITQLTQPAKTYPSQFIMVDDLFWLSNQRNLLPAYVGADPAQLAAGQQRCRDTALYLCPGLTFSKWITHDKGEYNQLRRAWRQAVMDDPAAYAARRWQTFALLLRSPSQPPYEILQIDVYQPNPEALRFAPNALGRALIGYVRLTSAWLPGAFKPYVWLLLGVAVALLAWRRRKPLGKDVVIPLALSGSALAYILGYALASQAADFRYIYWSIWAILLALIACLPRVAK